MAGEKPIKAWGCGKVVRDVHVLHPLRGDAMLEECSRCVSSQLETDKCGRVNFLKWRSMKRTSNWPPLAPYLVYLFRANTAVGSLFNSLSAALNAHRDGPPGSSRRQNMVLHTVRRCSIFHKTCTVPVITSPSRQPLCFSLWCIKSPLTFPF